MGWVVNATPRPLYTPGKTRYPLYRRVGRPQGRSGKVQKISESTVTQYVRAACGDVRGGGSLYNGMEGRQDGRLLHTVCLLSGVWCPRRSSMKFYIHGSVHHNSILINSNSMQVFIYCKITLHVSAVHRTHHQEYITLTAVSGTGHITYPVTFLQCGLITPRWRKVVAQIL